MATALTTNEENQLLREENRELRRRMSKLSAQLTTLTGRFESISKQLADSNDRIAELLAIVGRKSKPRSTKPTPPPKAPAHLDDEAREAFENRPAPPELEPRPQKEKKARKGGGRRPLPEHLPRDEHQIKPDACPECASTDLTAVRTRVEEKLHAVKAHQRVRRTVLTTCACKNCGLERIAPEPLPSPFSRSKATCEWLAWFTWIRHALLVPMDRIRRDLKRKRVDLPMSYLVSQVERVADILAPIEHVHWQQLMDGDWLAMDATGLKVQVRGLKGTTHNGYLEVFRNDVAVVFDYEPTKEAGPLEAKLAEFEGTVVADAEHRHNGLYADGTIFEGGCNAHGRRKLRDAEGAQPQLAAEAGLFISKVYEAERKGQAAGLVGDALRTWRQSECGPHFMAFKGWLSVVKETLLPRDELRKALQYYENHWDALTRFLDHPEIPIDNSATERIYQHIAKLRQNVLFAGSTRGAERMAVILGIVATCRLHGVDGEAYYGDREIPSNLDLTG